MTKFLLRLTICISLTLAICSQAQAAVTETFSDIDGKWDEITEFYRATGDVSVLSEATGLSNPRSGTITIDTIPDDATVLQAWLYWGGFTINVTETQLSNITFQGKNISYSSSPATVQVGYSNMQPNKNRYFYRADVSDLITSDGNGTYSVSVSHGKRDTFGASLVIVYEDPNSNHATVVINDGVVMISASSSKNPQHGNSYTSTIDNLSLSNPPNGQLTIVVSEGTATDATSLTFTGSSSHTYGDFTSNIDGKVWDDKTLDVANYISSSTNQIQTTLYDNDSAGAYVHYYMNIFKTNYMQGDLAQSSISVSDSTPKPEQIVELSTNIVNTGTTYAENGIYRIDIPENTTYVPGSTTVNGVPQTDNCDMTDHACRPDSNRIYVDIGNIAPGESYAIAFDIQTDDGLAHNTKISLQGDITANGIIVSTDGDGDPSDGIDRHLELTITGGVISFPSGYATRLKNATHIDPTSTQQTGEHTVQLLKDGGVIAEIDMDLDQDASISNIIGFYDESNKKALFHGIDQVSSKTKGSYTLVIPGDGTDRVRICLGALSLDEIHEGCADAYEHVTNEVVLYSGQSSSGITCNKIGTDWKCSGVTGSGGQGEEDPDPPAAPVGAPEFSDLAYILTVVTMMYLARRELVVNQQEA